MGSCLRFALFAAVFASSTISAGNSEAATAPTSVAAAKIGKQTAGSVTFYSSTQLAVSWVPPTVETVDYMLKLTPSMQSKEIKP